VSDSGALDSSLLVGFRAVEIFFHLAPGSQSENRHGIVEPPSNCCTG
jgi:hypothetical protein